MADDPVTIRLDRRSRMSNDLGESRWLTEEEARTIRNCLSHREKPLGMEPGAPTACTLASIGEGAHALPAGDAHVEVRPARGNHSVFIGDKARAESIPLKEVLDKRFSARDIGEVSLDYLATVLMRSGRTRAWVSGAADFDIEHRPAPSAGGRHPCTLMVAARGVYGLDDGWWHFDNLRGLLGRVDLEPNIGAFLNQQRLLANLSAAPSVAVVVVAEFQRTLARYPAGTVHVWRDAGALLATLHLNATDLGLRSCITGGVGSIHAPDWDDATADVGALVMGR